MPSLHLSTLFSSTDLKFPKWILLPERKTRLLVLVRSTVWKEHPLHFKCDASGWKPVDNSRNHYLVLLSFFFSCRFDEQLVTESRVGSWKPEWEIYCDQSCDIWIRIKTTISWYQTRWIPFLINTFLSDRLGDPKYWSFQVAEGGRENVIA